MEQLSLKVIENDKEIIYEVIATYHDDELNKDFVIYTDKTLNKDKKLNIYYSLYCVNNSKIELLETNNIEDKRIGLKLVKEIGKML